MSVQLDPPTDHAPVLKDQAFALPAGKVFISQDLFAPIPEVYQGVHAQEIEGTKGYAYQITGGKELLTGVASTHSYLDSHQVSPNAPADSAIPKKYIIGRTESVSLKNWPDSKYLAKDGLCPHAPPQLPKSNK